MKNAVQDTIDIISVPKSVKAVPRSFAQKLNTMVQGEAKPPSVEERICDMHGLYLVKMFELFRLDFKF
jgi:hypothetical protein